MLHNLLWIAIGLGLFAAAFALGRKLLLGAPYTMGPVEKLGRLFLALIAGSGVFLAAGAVLIGSSDGTAERGAGGGGTPESEAGGATRSEDGWVTSLDEGFKQSAATGKPALVDAWAVWCTSCVKMKKETFKDPVVRNALEAYVPVALDMDAPENEQVWDRYRIRGLPWIAVFEPGKTDAPRWVLSDAEGADAFARRLGGAVEKEEGVADWLAGRGILITLLLVFLGGILASLTPCAYPTYLLVFGFFSSPEAGTVSKGRTTLTALTLVLGMASSYAAAGVLAALGGGAVGRFMNDPWVMGGVAALFLLMGASSLSVLPPMEFSRLKGALHSRSKANLLWAFVFGLVMGLIVAPCVGPLLIGILTYIAASSDVALGILLMVTFALGMGVLFFVLAFFSQTIRSRIRVGAWSELITVLFAIIFFAAAFYYLKGVLPYDRLFSID